jgi:hypothetical protein
LIEIKDVRHNGIDELLRDFDYRILPRSGRNASNRLAGCAGDTFTWLRGAAEEVRVVESLRALSSQTVDQRLWTIEEIAEMFSVLWIFCCNSSRATRYERLAINVPLQRRSLQSNRMKWCMKYFSTLGGNPHCQMCLLLRSAIENWMSWLLRGIRDQLCFAELQDLMK